MGCIPSKTIARTMSIREELVNHNFHNTSSIAWEELLTSSHNRNDHRLFAYLRSANTNTTTKLRTTDFILPSTDPETTPLETSTYLSSENNAKAEAQSGRFTRSKSCQILRETDQNDGLNEHKLDWKDKSVMIGSRSFHTVEEYDAFLARIHRFSSTGVESFEDYYSSEDVKLLQSDGNQNEPGKSDEFEKVVQVDCTRETGWKRKAVAKELKSLDVSNIEFPAIARFRQRIHAEGQIYSPGTYVTPKFGSYNARVTSETREKEGGGENSVFSPELLAAFEECMQQLQIDEDNILKDMDELSPVDDEMENQVEVPSNKNVDV